MTADIGRRTTRAAAAAVLAGLVSLAGLAGCSTWGSAGSLTVRSLSDEPVMLAAQFESAVYTHDPRAETSFWLSDVPADDIQAGRVTEGQVFHIELLWRPKAGATPMDASATNASIRYVVMSHGEVGVYIGAGFVQVRGSLGQSNVTVSVRDASLRLAEATPGFRDVLGPAELTGTFSSRRNPEEARRLFVTVSQYVTDALGSSRYVQAVPASSVARGASARPSGAVVN